MKERVYKWGAILLALILLCGVTASAADSSENVPGRKGTYTTIENIDGMYSWTVLDAKTTTVETMETDPVTGVSRVVFERTFEGVKASVSRESYIVCDITVTMIENTNNTSGFEMTGVKSVAITDFSGWHGARSAKVSNTTYGDGRQKVVIEISFSSQLEVGAPWLTQTASTTLSIL